MISWFWVYAALFALMLFAGLSLYQGTASHAELGAKARRFAELAEEGGMEALARVRWLAYGLVPLGFLGLLLAAGLPFLSLFACALKIGVTVALSLWIENRLLSGEGYSPIQHRLARGDSWVNLLVAAAMVYALLYMRR